MSRCPIPPPTPVACCFPDGTCHDLNPLDCHRQGGRPQGPGSSCANTVCPVLGACCVQGLGPLGPICVETTGPNCLLQGGHFFGAAHTLERYETAFYVPLISDWRNYETWEESGAETATQRAHKISKRVLAEFEPPPLDPAVKEELEAFVARRKEEGGVAAA